MSFAELVTEMNGVCFSDAGLGEAATYTAPTEGAVAVAVRAVLDEPTEDPFPRALSRSQFKESVLSAWIERRGVDGTLVEFVRSGTLVITTSHGVVRTVTLVSPKDAEPDRVRWAVSEAA